MRHPAISQLGDGPRRLLVLVMVNKTVIELKRGALDTVERQVLLLNVRIVRICNARKAPPAPLLEDPAAAP